MTRSLPSLRIPKFATVFLLAIFLTTICMTPTETHARRVEELSMPDNGGSNRSVTPGQGDDDQPTGDGEGGRRTTVAMTGPDEGTGGGFAEPRVTRFRIVKDWFVRSGIYVKRLVGYVP